MKMTRPTECKHCGLHGVWDIDDDTFFACGTSWCGRVDIWNQSTGCVEIVQSRERIKRAVEVLEGAERFDVIPWDGGIRRDPAVDGWETDSGILDQLIEILKGNSPESPDSSPVTADQLATEDYYEAVRQRVPWMTSIEHIEGLVEGYRQCGLMVWEAAEQIQRI